MLNSVVWIKQCTQQTKLDTLAKVWSSTISFWTNNTKGTRAKDLHKVCFHTHPQIFIYYDHWCYQVKSLAGINYFVVITQSCTCNFLNSLWYCWLFLQNLCSDTYIAFVTVIFWVQPIFPLALVHTWQIGIIKECRMPHDIIICINQCYSQTGLFTAW